MCSVWTASNTISFYFIKLFKIEIILLHIKHIYMQKIVLFVVFLQVYPSNITLMLSRNSVNLKGQFTQKFSFCDHLLTLK